MRFAQCDILNDTALHALLPEGVDAVVSLNVFEHIENDARALANVVDILKPGGHLLIAVPALMMLYNELDRLAGHCRRYTKARLRTLLDDEPVEIIKLNYMNAVGGLGWWVNSFSRPSSLNESGINQQIRIFDRYIVPVSKALDPLFRQYFGQSLICIARRL
jgi:SAM-dependent methyltransferase